MGLYDIGGVPYWDPVLKGSYNLVGALIIENPPLWVVYLNRIVFRSSVCDPNLRS